MESDDLSRHEQGGWGLGLGSGFIGSLVLLAHKRGMKIDPYIAIYYF